MSLRTKIIGNQREYEAAVDSDGFLHANVKDYYNYSSSVRFFLNETYGDNLAKNASSTGLIENVHDGTDHIYWTGSVIYNNAGDYNFASLSQNHTPGGSKSINFSGASNNDIGQMYRGSYLDLTDYSYISGWIYITGWNQTGVKELLIYGYDTVNDIQVGTAVNIGDYVTTTTTGEWQNFNIQLSDMGLTNQTIDALRFKMVESGVGIEPNGYLDDIEIVGTSSSSLLEYILEPDVGETLQIKKYTYVLAQDYDNTLTDATMPNLSYNKLLNKTLTNGLLYRRHNNGIITYSVIWKNLAEILTSPGSKINNYVSDGSSVMITIDYEFAEPIFLYYSERDKVSLQITEDFSDFSFFRVSANCRLLEN